MNKLKIKKMTLAALLTAVIAASAWISVPTPFGVNLTLQTFGVCLAGFVLGAKWGMVATAAYLAIGAVGLPVFSSFTGGIGVLFGASGGFLFGFLFSAVLCGMAKNATRKPIEYLLMCLSVLICHTTGVIQFSYITGNGVLAAFLSASLPFLLKDFIIVFFAGFISKKIKF